MTKHFRGISNPFSIWVFANILGFSVLGLAILILPSLMSMPGLLGSTFIISIPISLAQWFALRRVSPVSVLWILSIPIGILLAIFIIREIPAGLLPMVDDESPLVLTVLCLLIGFVIGLPQWLILRRHYANSSIWLLGSSIGVGLGCGILIARD